MVKKLYNKKSKEELVNNLNYESFKRITCSFYNYTPIENPEVLRDNIYSYFESLNIFGRVYIASEGINAQISVPDYKWKEFKAGVKGLKSLINVPIKKAVSDGISFYKLVVKIKKEIVAYGLSDNTYDMNKVGQYLQPEKCRDTLGREIQRITTRGKKNVKWSKRSSGIIILHGWH